MPCAVQLAFPALGHPALGHATLGWLLLALVVAGTAFHLVSAYAAWRFAQARVPPVDAWPPISVLKPVRGVDPEAYESYASFCRQDYPEYELLFGVQDQDDPVIALVERLKREFPGTRIGLVVSHERVGENLKVCNLHNMLPHARHEWLVVSDSDMRVSPDYLRQISASLQQDGVGLVTSPYIGVGARSLSAGLEALGMATDFFPGVAVASAFAPPSFALGSTLAMSRSHLQAIGGFRELAAYLADDFQMGYRTAQLGKRVALSRYVVDTVLPNEGFAPMAARRLRWNRTARACQPAGYAGSLVMHSTVWALGLALSGGLGVWGWAVLAAQQAVRAATAAYIAGGVLRSRDAMRWFWLLPASDVLSCVLWAGSWFGSSIVWRGDHYRIGAGGKLIRCDGSTAEHQAQPLGGVQGFGGPGMQDSPPSADALSPNSR